MHIDIYNIVLMLASSSVLSEFKFAMYPPSMIAAGSVSAAANGLLGLEWVQKVRLMDRLQSITGIDQVSIFSPPSNTTLQCQLIVSKDRKTFFHLKNLWG